MNLEKEELFTREGIYIARSEIHRWGVFTDEDIKAYDVIQEVPYCTFPAKELKKSDIVVRYSYSSDGVSDQVDECVIGFGFAPLYNHDSENFNVAYELDVVNEVMRHYALNDIEAGTELCIDYGCGEDWGEDDY
jgi:SET domain-containing protein